MINLSKTVGLGVARGLRLLTLIALLFIAVSSVNAQTSKAQMDYTRLVGVDPADIVTEENNYRLNVYYQTEEEEKNNELNGLKKTFFLMNVGTHKFLNIGGSYGRHTTLSDYGMKLWIYGNSTTKGTYNIRTRQNIVPKTGTDKDGTNNSDSYIQYVSNDPHLDGVYPDCQPTDVTNQYGWFFEKASGYSDNNKVYKIKTYGNRYLTAVPNDPKENKCQAITEEPAVADYQLWKLVTLEEYFALLEDSPSDSADPIDITFLMKEPGLKYNKSSQSYWLITGTGKIDNVRFGINDYYKKQTEKYYKNETGTQIGFNDYLFENGKYFCADIKETHNVNVEQWVTINKAGWYVVRCNGFSNTNGLAELHVKELYSNYYGIGTPIKAQTTLKTPNGPTDLLQAGMAFYKGEYPNEVKIYIPQKLIDELEGHQIKKTEISVGITVGGDNSTSASGEWTAFDNFRLLYYGDEAEKPELVLDEENPDLSYLTESSDTYENTKLHLNRSFSLNKWNTLTLPVDLTYGQMKSAFGDDVQLAQLFELSATSIRFKTVECTTDDEVMLNAFTPYIIKPTKAADATTAVYTTPRLKKTSNQYWQAKGVGVTNAEDGVTRHISGKVSVKAGHYTIDGVKLDRTKLKENLDAHWVSTTTTSASDMVCKGTMAKTYYVQNGNGYFYTDNGTKRDDLAGDYFMNKGTMWKVPTTKQYGLKGFRCWFELTSATDATSTTTAPAKDVTLFIDGVNTDVTSIDGVTIDTHYSASGVYNLYGQRLRSGSSLEGLPSGIYIVNGKKIKK